MRIEPRHKGLSEDQVNAALRRAVEIQHGSPMPASESNVSVEDLIRMGSELGLDASALRKAIDEVLAGGSRKSQTTWKLGIPFRIDESRTLPVELTHDDWHALVEAVRKHFGTSGKASEIAGTLEYLAAGSLRMNLRPKKGASSFRLEFGNDGIAAVVGLFVFLLSLLALVLGARGLISGVPGWIAAFGSVLAVGGFAWHRVTRFLALKQYEAVQAVMALAEQLALARSQEAASEVSPPVNLSTPEESEIRLRLGE